MTGCCCCLIVALFDFEPTRDLCYVTGSSWQMFLDPHTFSYCTTLRILKTLLDATDVVSPQHFQNWCLTHDWHLSIFKHCLTGTFCYVSTVSLAPLFESKLSQGHLPLCDIHAYIQPRHFQSLLNPFWVPFVNKIWIDPTWLIASWGQFLYLIRLPVTAMNNYSNSYS